MKLSIVSIIISLISVGFSILFNLQSMRRDIVQLDLINTNQQSIVILLKSSLELADSISGKE